MMPTEAEINAMTLLVHPDHRAGYRGLQKIERERIIELCLIAHGNELRGMLLDQARIIVDQLRDMSHARG